MSFEDIGLPAAVAAGVWGAFSEVMKIAEILNGRRDLVLNIQADGERLTPEQRDILLKNDWLPTWIGLEVFLVIFTLAFGYVCYTVNEARILTGLATALGIFAIGVQIWAGWTEYWKMRQFIDSERKPKPPEGEGLP